jgi:GNAT superfamily N-acetyltransferase
MELELREVTPEVLDELRTHVVLPPHQREWVGGTVDDSLQEAAELPEGNPWPRGVYVDGVPAGVVMLSWDVVPDPPDLYGPWFLWKLMVAPAFQGQGVGTAVVRHVAALAKENGGTQLLTSVSQGEYAAWGEEILVLAL